MKNKIFLCLAFFLMQELVFAKLPVNAKKRMFTESNQLLTYSVSNSINLYHNNASNNKNKLLPPPNLPPIARAGIDTAVQLPTDSLIIKGCSSSDPENASLKYKWRKISGPASFLIVYDTACTTRLRGLVSGSYTFELAVTDTGNLVSKDSVSITVYPVFTIAWPAPAVTLCNRIYKIVVVGSSTAFGTGASPIDSSWVRKYRTYVLAQNTQIQVINIATLGLTSYDVSPTGTVVPAPFTVDIDRNITKALSFNPDAIILNLPSNDVARGIPTNTIHQNMRNITNAANAQNVPIWVSTTQPRDGLSPSEKILQMELRDWINLTYGNKSIDFWTSIANADGTINSVYTSGDGVHLNNTGHHTLFTRTIAEKIWDTICIRNNIAPIARAGNDITVTTSTSIVSLNGSSSTDSDGTIVAYQWAKIAGPAQGTLSNANLPVATYTAFAQGNYSFKLSVTDNIGTIANDTMQLFVNSVVLALDTTTNNTVAQQQYKSIIVYPNPSNDFFKVRIPKELSNNYFISISDDVGKIIFTKAGIRNNGLVTELIDVRNLSKGLYVLRFYNKDKSVLVQKLIKL